MSDENQVKNGYKAGVTVGGNMVWEDYTNGELEEEICLAPGQSP